VGHIPGALAVYDMAAFEGTRSALTHTVEATHVVVHVLSPPIGLGYFTVFDGSRRRRARSRRRRGRRERARRRGGHRTGVWRKSRFVVAKYGPCMAAIYPATTRAIELDPYSLELISEAHARH